MTATPGASAYFMEGVVTYSNQAKRRLLGVEERTLEERGAVSSGTAAEMAAGLRHRAGVDLAVSVTGIAGPDGGTPEKPVGLVYFGLAGPDRVVVERRRFPFSGGVEGRARVQSLACATALDLARRFAAGGS